MRQRMIGTVGPMRAVSVATVLAVALIGSQGAAQACAHCGTERWPVKTMSDRDRGKVDPRPLRTTVGALGALAMPRYRPDNARIAPTELTTFRIHAKIVGWKGESDQDFHLVVADPENPLETMIVEVPSPGCAGVCISGKVRDMVRVRQTVLDHLGRVPNGRLTCLDPEPGVIVTGVGFFDRPHSQSGRAPNAIELHPVLDLQFDDPSAAPRHVSCRTGVARTQSRPNGHRQVSGAPYATPPVDSEDAPARRRAGATAQCRDGSLSYSAHHSGTCSRHGGVAAWL